LSSFIFKNPNGLPPYAHQLRIYNQTCDLPYWAMFMEMGTGKSAVILWTWAHLFLDDMIDAAIVFAKKGEYDNWPEHLIPDHLPDEVAREVFTFDSDTFKQKGAQARWDKFLNIREKHTLRILVVNVEAVDGDTCWDSVHEFYERFDTRVFWVGDEATWLKNLTTLSTRGKASKKNQRAKRMITLRDLTPYRRIMAGLPNPKGPLDVWGQTLMLTKEPVLGFDNYYAFRNYYGVLKKQYMGPNRPSFDKVVGYQRLDELQERLKKFSSIITLDECVDLPGKLYDKRAIPLTKEQRKLYDEMRDTAMVTLQGALGKGAYVGEPGEEALIIEAHNVLSQFERLHQITCGQLKLGPDSYKSIPNNRLSTLGEILEDHPDKAIVWAAYRQTGEDAFDHLTKIFGPGVVARYYGSTDQEERRRVIRDFQEAELLRFIVASSAMAYSHTLTAGDLNIYYSNTFNLEHRIQSEFRTRRIGQKKVVRYIDFYAPGTIDERIMDVLREKKVLSHAVLGTPLSKWI